MKILFFGSTSNSVTVLNSLSTAGYTISAVITQPPRPIGRKHVVTPTPTEMWAKDHEITVLSFPNATHASFLYEDENAVINTLSTWKADLLISASYGQKIPTQTIHEAEHHGLNVHPSLLPRWRGADPIPWQIIAGDHQTGATVVTLTEKMDEGKIIAQKKIPLTGIEEREPLRQKLFDIGSELLIETLPLYLQGNIDGQPQQEQHALFARRLKREDGYIPFGLLQKAMIGQSISTNELPGFLQSFNNTDVSASELFCRAIRGLSPWPGVWTYIKDTRQPNQEKIRMKILKANIKNGILFLDEVQIEGKNPTLFSQLPGITQG